MNCNCEGQISFDDLSCYYVYYGVDNDGTEWLDIFVHKADIDNQKCLSDHVETMRDIAEYNRSMGFPYDDDDIWMDLDVSDCYVSHIDLSDIFVSHLVTVDNLMLGDDDCG